MTMRRWILIVLIAALGATTDCTKEEDVKTAAPIEVEQSSEWEVFLSAFLDDYFAINPTFAVYQGRHEFDGQLPDWSEQGLKKQIDSHKKAITEARAIAASRLTEAQQYERD